MRIFVYKLIIWSIGNCCNYKVNCSYTCQIHVMVLKVHYFPLKCCEVKNIVESESNWVETGNTRVKESKSIPKIYLGTLLKRVNHCCSLTILICPGGRCYDVVVCQEQQLLHSTAFLQYLWTSIFICGLKSHRGKGVFMSADYTLFGKIRPLPLLSHSWEHNRNSSSPIAQCFERWQIPYKCFSGKRKVVHTLNIASSPDFDQRFLHLVGRCVVLSYICHLLALHTVLLLGSEVQFLHHNSRHFKVNAMCQWYHFVRSFEEARQRCTS